MNTKKNKNKPKQNKQPNPQPKAEKSETTTEKTDQIDVPMEEQEKAEILKSEERVPEIVSEIVTPVVETKVSEGDTPKKPKRNRGKKKKSDKDDEFEEQEQREEKLAVVEERIVSELQGSEETQETENKGAMALEITPAARKKKNKNKKQIEQETEKATEQEVKIVPFKKGEEPKDLKIVTVVPVETDESKSKKKNKKKKRTDSERSDKAEEVISCTAAFQKLMESKDEKKDKKDVKEEEVKPMEEIIVKEPVKEESIKVCIDTDIKQELVPSDKSVESKETLKEEGGKSKKKNKKDKKQPKFESEDESKSTEMKIEMISEGKQPISIALETDVKLETKKDIIDEHIKIEEKNKPFEETPVIDKEKSPKPKAKIAKPVDKKRKGKSEFSGTEALSDKEFSDIKLEEKPVAIELSSQPPVELKEEVQPVLPIVLPQKEDVKSTETIKMSEETSKPTEIVRTQETAVTEMKTEIRGELSSPTPKLETISIPDSGKNKKRKKSPKPKSIEARESTNKESASVKLEETVEIKEVFPLPPETFKDKPVITEPEKEEIKPTPSESESEKAPQKQSEPIPLGFEITMPVEAIYTEILQTPEIIKTPEIVKESVPVKVPQDKEKMQVPETGTSKKRKKSPKMPRKFDRADESVKQSTESSDIVKDQDQKEELPSPSMPLLEDIEIRSVKAEESEGSSCDIVPDVQYPRASSQLLDDNNNNTIIQEILASDTKLNIPHASSDTPLIQGSGETPMITTQLYPTGVRITEIETTASVQKEEKPTVSQIVEKELTPKPDERTDLKSKVLDVNQGMEELRKSIERSLAELTFMEKSEQEAQEQFSKAQAKLEQISDLASKKSQDRQTLLVSQMVEQVKNKKAETPKDQEKLPEIQESQTPLQPKIEQLHQKSQEVPIPKVEDTKTEVLQRVEAQKSQTPSKEKPPQQPKAEKPHQKSQEVPIPKMEDIKPEDTRTVVSQTLEIQELQTPSKEMSPQQSKAEKPHPKAQEVPFSKVEETKTEGSQSIPKETKTEEQKPAEVLTEMPLAQTPPVCPSRKVEAQKSQTPSKEKPPQQPKAEKPHPKAQEVPFSKGEETKAEVSQCIPKETNTEEQKPAEILTETPLVQTPPVCPSRKDNKGKGKKKKGKQESEYSGTTAAPTAASEVSTATSTSAGESKEPTQEKKEEKTKQKTDSSKTQEKGKQQSASTDVVNDDDNVVIDIALDSITDSKPSKFEPIESFEDALTSSNEDVNKTFEIIANEANKCDPSQNPEINITAPVEDEEKNTESKEIKDQDKINPVSQPKNLIGHPNIPARLNRTDYKKEKNKPPNTRQARVKIKDAVPVEVSKQSKECQTENKRRFLKDKTVTETISSVINDNEEYIYKYSFRKVFLPSACHVCKKDLKPTRVPCSFCNLVFYCSAKHKDEDYPQHQGLCFAVSTIVHLKEQKHIYADAKNITGHEYRLLRMQMIVSCEKVLKRRLSPWEQEALLYPRMCADAACREWRQSKLVDCDGCGQVAYCADSPDHLPKSHQRWCKSYSLYNKLVVYQQTKGRLEPVLPTRIMADVVPIPEKLNEVLASMYEEKIDMTDIQYAALTQIATAPLTAAYCQQLYTNSMNSVYANGVHKKSSFTIHVVGAELQFEADALNKWEVFFLHLRPDIKDLRLVLIGPDLNPSNLPLDLLGKIKMCENCQLNKRRVMFDFQDNKTYNEYWSTEFTTPDLVCAFNPSIQRSSVFNGKDTWPSTIRCISKLKVPFIITSYTMTELQRDLLRIKECCEVDITTIAEAKYNAFASVRPDRNFISDDEMPLLFKNFCFSVVCGSY